MRKFMFLLMLLTLVALPVAAQDEVEPWVCPEGFEGQTLSVYNWSTYIAEDTIPNFEELCGVTVIYDVFANNEEVLSRLRQGNPGYDIAVPTDYMVAIMAAEELLEPLNKNNIPNFANLNPALLDEAFDPGNEFSVPYQWGSIGIGYNVETVGEEITSWDQVWTYEGPVAWLDEYRAVMGVALQLLGYDPNTENPDEIAQARDFLAANGGNVVAIAQDDGQVMLERGDVDITIEWSGDIFQLIDECACDTYAYVIPAEGSNFFTDNLVIPVGAPNQELAEVFIDYILHPQVGADISNFTAYGSPNQTAIDNGLIDEALLNNPGIYPPDEVVGNLFITTDTAADQDFNDAWNELKILLGQ